MIEFYGHVLPIESMLLYMYPPLNATLSIILSYSVLVWVCLEALVTFSYFQAKRELSAQLADRMCELQDAQEKLKERERIHEQACRTIQKLMQKLSSQEKEIKRLNQQQQKEQSVNKEVSRYANLLSDHHYMS